MQPYVTFGLLCDLWWYFRTRSALNLNDTLLNIPECPPQELFTEYFQQLTRTVVYERFRERPLSLARQLL